MKRLVGSIVLIMIMCFHMPVFADEPPQQMTILLVREYVGGDVKEEMVTTKEMSIEKLKQQYSGWQLIDYNESQVMFKQVVNDISPLMKENGYFGMTNDGILKIFEGTPSEERVIQSFFKIDTQKLQTYKRHRLQRGIPVCSKERFEEVMKEMKEYAKKTSL